jgi:C4-type Zn-finger protein
MATRTSPCPNCGASMATLRKDRQVVGQREVQLTWMICARCRHVRLEHWGFIDVDIAGDDRAHHRHHA